MKKKLKEMQENRARQPRIEKMTQKMLITIMSEYIINKYDIKLLSDERKITCGCCMCYHTAYEIRHLNSKVH